MSATANASSSRPAWRHVAELLADDASPWTMKLPARCDPYLIWADVTTTTEPVAKVDFPTIGVLVELDSAADRPRLESECRLVPSGAEPGGKPSRFVCGLVDRDGLHALVKAVGGMVRRFTLQASRVDLSRVQWINYRLARNPAIPHQPAEPGGVVATAGATLVAAAKSAASRESKWFIGIVDDGLPFAQLTASARAQVRMWDQGWLPGYLRSAPDGMPAALGSVTTPGLGSAWLNPWVSTPILRGFYYGRRLNPIYPPGPERATYAAAEYFDPPPARTHGAGVLGRLAPWMLGRGAAGGTWPSKVAGVAMVQLPSLTVEDTSGGSLEMRVLDALRFVLWQEEETRPAGAKARKIVANVSYGTHAGPHDGSSMFEAATKELLDKYRDVTLVLPVGNSHRQRCHCARVLEPSQCFEMPWRILPDAGRDIFMEIWFDALATMRIEVTPPGHSQAVVVYNGEAKVYVVHDAGASGQRIEFAVIYPPSVAQSLSGSMALIAVSPTRRLGSASGVGMNQLPRTRIGAPHGLWKVKVVNQDTVQRRFDAWVQRGDAAPDSLRGHRQAFFPDSATDPTGSHPSTPNGTLNGIATLVHGRLHVVGALRELDGGLSDYSAAGPRRGDSARDSGPDKVVKADRSHALPGLLTSGFAAGARTHMNGTSMACAVFANDLLGLTKPIPPPLPKATAEIDAGAEHAPSAADSDRGQQVRKSMVAEEKPPPS
jgi:hypothetical protein